MNGPTPQPDEMPPPRPVDRVADEEPPRAMDWVRARTPARILVDRAGGSYRTTTWLQLRGDHAAARDAVMAELDPARAFGAAFVERWGLFEVSSCARTKHDYLTRPELGRTLDEASREAVTQSCPSGVDLQVAIGDGLSASAVAAQVPALLPLLAASAEARGWRFGRPFFVRHCRVGVLNDVGELLDPTVVVLLIGERPGLATAESLSAYMAFRPRPGDDDSRRNLISNIHSRGVSCEDAATRIIQLAERMRLLQKSGVSVKEEASPVPMPGATGPKGLDHA